VRPVRFSILISVIFLPTFLATPLAAQPEPVGGGFGLRTTLQDTERHIWHIFGKVVDLKGAPIAGAKVHVDAGYGMKYLRDVKTDSQGRFKTQYEFDYSTVKTLAVNLAITRKGYRTARETFDFGTGDLTWEIKVTMREETPDRADLSQDALVAALAPKVRQSLDSDPALDAGRKDLRRGEEEFFDRQDLAKAISPLERAAKKLPECIDCRMLLGLARLAAGSFNSALDDFAHVTKDGAPKGTKIQQARLNLISGVLEDWKGEYNKAAGFLMQANEQAPHDPLILQELGRTLEFQSNWEAADQYLDEAIQAGASKEVIPLRARALLEQGDALAAQALLKQYMGDRPAKGFPPDIRALHTQIIDRLKLDSGTRVSSVVDQPVDALLVAIPALRGLEPAASQEDLPGILAKAGEDVQTFFQNFPNTVSDEQVREELLGKKGEAKDTLQEKFQYLLMAKPETWGVGLEEIRADEYGGRTASQSLKSGLMLTSGFATASLLFHPSYQPGAAFRLLGRQAAAGHRCQVVAFAQNPAKAKTCERFDTSTQTVLVHFQGVAWIDADTYKIVRLRSDLLAPQPAIRLLRQTTEINYAPVQFKQVAAAMWLPSDVAVTVDWHGQTFRNSHTYSHFRLFNIEMKDKPHEVEPVPPADTPSGPGF
jgi:tetratricopeptide (TPR) repeat protein